MNALKTRLVGLLRSTERYTKTDMVYLFKSGSFLTGSDGLLTIVSLGVSVLIAAMVPKETFGIYRYVIAIAAVAAALSLSGMNSAVTRAVALGRDGAFGLSLPIQARFAMLQVFALGLIAAYYFFKGNASYGIAFSAIALLAPAAGVLNTYTAYLAGKKEFKRLSWWKAQGGLLQAGAMVAVIFASPTVLGLIIAYFFTSLIANGYFTVRILRRKGLNKMHETSDIAYGKHLSVMNAANVFATQLDALLIYHLLGPISLAVYAFAILIPDRLRSLTSFLPNIALPKLAERSSAELLSTVAQRLLIILGATGAIAVAYAAAAPTLFSLFFPQYLEAIPFTQLAGFLVMGAAAVYLETILTSQAAYKKLYVVSLATPAFKVILSIILILLFGIAGAIASRILSGLFSGILSLTLVRRT